MFVTKLEKESKNKKEAAQEKHQHRASNSKSLTNLSNGASVYGTKATLGFQLGFDVAIMLC